MPTFDVVDEALIDAAPAQIAHALKDEFSGHSRWWQPFMVIRPVGDVPAGEVGSLTDVTVNASGDPTSRFGLSFRQRMVAAEEGRIEFEYVSGPFRGRFEITLEPVDTGHTRIRARWQAEPHGTMHVLNVLVNVPARHSIVMQKGFARMSHYIHAGAAAA